MALEIKDTVSGAIKLVLGEDKIQQIFKKIVNTQIGADCFFAGVTTVVGELEFKLVDNK